jgi:hypothetical protein
MCAFSAIYSSVCGYVRDFVCDGVGMLYGVLDEREMLEGWLPVLN